MKAKEDKNIEKLADKIMRNATLDAPSFDFTSKVMSQVLAVTTSDVTVYKPLISKSVFIVIFGCILALFIYIFINGESQTNSWFNTINFSTLYNNRITAVFNFSKITTYAVVLTTLMFFVQIPFLKNHFEKQIEK